MPKCAPIRDTQDPICRRPATPAATAIRRGGVASVAPPSGASQRFADGSGRSWLCPALR